MTGPTLPQALIVLGAAVWPGGRPSPALDRRVRHAVALWRPGDILILTGGLGAHPPAEAEVATRLALSLGIPRAATRQEARSTRTVENILFALPLLPPGAVPILVTDRYHTPRARAVARMLGVPMRADPAPPRAGMSLRLRLRATLREVFALPMSLIRARRARFTSAGSRARP